MLFFFSSLVDGRSLYELNNEKFVDFRVNVNSTLVNAKNISSTMVMKYIKTISNGI